LVWAPGALGDGEKFLNGGLATAGLEAFVAFPQSFLDGTSHGLAGGLGDRPSETVGFRILETLARSSYIRRKTRLGRGPGTWRNLAVLQAW
jgi:hypothetical protein